MPSESALVCETDVIRPPAKPQSSALAAGLPVPGRDDSNVGRLGALVLTRRVGESIMVGGRVEVTVNEIRSGSVRLMVVAPRSIEVDRREVFDAKRAQPAPATPSARHAASPAAPGRDESPGRLILARSAGQSIMIGETVEVAIVEVRPATIKLRITAPKSVKVDRREVFESRLQGPA